jgi:hypothetical protein
MASNTATGTIIRIALQFLLNVRQRNQQANAPTYAQPGPGDIPPQQPHWEYRPDGSRVLVMPEQTIYGDNGGPSRVGDPFPTRDAAASAALREIYSYTMDENAEYAGRIYRNPDGTYSFSTPVSDGSDRSSSPENSPVPPGSIVVGTYHSHGAGFNPSDELFSPQDKLKATMSQQPSYLLTPMGGIFKYTPVTLLPPAEQVMYPQGRVTRLS